nr:MAG TPA: hypothetical protein [Caudoviricetes sp.]
MITDEQANLIKAAPEKVIIRLKASVSSISYTDYTFTNTYSENFQYTSAQVTSSNTLYGCTVYIRSASSTIRFYNYTYQTAFKSYGYTISDSNYRSDSNVYYFGAGIQDNNNFKITINTDITYIDANLSILLPSKYWIDSNQLTKVTIVKGNYNTILIPVKGLNTGEPTIYLSLDEDSGIATILIEESPNPTCYDTNETIDFTSIMAEYQTDITKQGKLRPFTSSDTLLSSAAIKAIIDGNYKMFSFNAKIGDDTMKAYMPISYNSDVNFYTFKGQVTFYNAVWSTIDVQMQFIHNPTTGSYTNNPGYGFFKFTPETAISA